MAKKLCPVLFLFLAMIPVPLAAQKRVHGTVIDAETRTPLPFANIQIEDTFRGTTSNTNGEYSLSISRFPATVIIRYIGYASERITITAASAGRQDIALQPIVLEMKAVVVTGEDPAVLIMREVIKRKQQWRQKLDTYRAEAYSRQVVENDTGIVFIIENTTEVFWNREKGTREVIKSRKRTENFRYQWAQAATSNFPNLYDDHVEIQGNEVIGPTHPDAIDYYDFKLVGQRALDNKVVYDISMKPKSKLQPTFSGDIAILDKEYAMINAKLKTNKSLIDPFMIQEQDLYFEQQYSNFGQEFWLPVDARVKGELKIGISGLISIPQVRFSALSRVTDYEVNVPLPDSLYKKNRIVSFDSLVLKKDTLLVSEADVIPLTEKQQAAYEKIDSTYTLDKAFKPTGPLARFVHMDEDGNGGGKSKSLAFNWSPDVHYNRVDAGHLGLNLNATAGRFSFGVHAAYKTALKKFGYGGRIKLEPFKKLHVGASYLSDTVTRYGSLQYSQIVNSIWSLQGGDDYFDYYQTKRLRLEAGFRLPTSRHVSSGFNVDGALEFVAALQSEHHSSLQKQTDFNIYGLDNTQRTNPEIEEGNLRSLEFKLRFGDKTEEPLGILGRKRVEILVEHSLPGLLSSDFSFTRYQAAVDWRFTTFLGRRRLPNVLDLRLLAGTSSGHLPVQRFGVIEGRLGAFSPFAVLKTLERPYAGEKYLGLFWEHNFRTVPFELIGWQGPVEHRIHLILHGGIGRTWLSDRVLQEPGLGLNYIDGFHHEIGVALSGILSLFRLDASKRLDRRGFAVGIGFARIF